MSNRRKNRRRSSKSNKMSPVKSRDFDAAKQNGGFNGAKESEPEPNPEAICYECSTVVLEKALQCDCCNFWHHIGCVGIDMKFYRLLDNNKINGIRWYCRKCDKGMENLKKMITTVQERQEKTESRLAQLESEAKETKGLKERVEELEKSFKETQAQTTTATGTPQNTTYAMMAASDNKPIFTKSDREIVSESVEELREREKRKHNILLYNVPESTADDVEARKEHDLTKVDEVLDTLDLKGRVTITKPVRLAKSKIPEHADKPRPLRVTLTDDSKRKEILQRAKNLDERKKSRMKNIFLKRDLTPLERTEIAKRMAAQIKKRSAEEETKADNEQDTSEKTAVAMEQTPNTKQQVTPATVNAESVAAPPQ